MKRSRRSVESDIIDYFRTAPNDVAEAIFGVVRNIMQQRGLLKGAPGPKAVPKRASARTEAREVSS